MAATLTCETTPFPSHRDKTFDTPQPKQAEKNSNTLQNFLARALKSVVVIPVLTASDCIQCAQNPPTRIELAQVMVMYPSL